ncbi:PepSY domain-containing protein [Maribacter chungangensis]|uniref:PepSY domain-containing protein n=1 Tax=Maribacter chungangensis TaxID=1069117 RepID=A0ABW3B0J3_9FLAO
MFRKAHRITGATLFIFFFIIAGTGLLLGWKKNTGDLLGSKTYNGTTTELTEWLPLSQLQLKAETYLKNSVPVGSELQLDRIDIRQNKGVAKFIYNDYYGIQIDGATGTLLHVDRRRADFIENMHDASLLDDHLNTGGYIKLAYTTIMSLSLLLFTITGFWLWYGPKRMRKGVHQ